MWGLKALTVLFGLMTYAGITQAGQATVAVAANFVNVLRELRGPFEHGSGHKLMIVVGSTGKLSAQIMQGAPFDVLLAADSERPQKLVDAGLAVQRYRTTYALGRLALWSANADLSEGNGLRLLQSGTFRHIAIANPRLAPYGQAAIQTLRSLMVLDRTRASLVEGESIGQAFALIASGSANAGFVALSQILHAGLAGSPQIWQVPAELHAPIRQEAVLLKRGMDNDAAIAFMLALKAEKFRKIIEEAGYGAASGEN